MLNRIIKRECVLQAVLPVDVLNEGGETSGTKHHVSLEDRSCFVEIFLRKLSVEFVARVDGALGELETFSGPGSKVTWNNLIISHREGGSKSRSDVGEGLPVGVIERL